jgi:hypothetical protein
MTLGFSLNVWIGRDNAANYAEFCAAHPCPASPPRGAIDDLMGYPGASYQLMGYIVYAFGLPLAVLAIGLVGARVADGFRSKIKNG